MPALRLLAVCLLAMHGLHASQPASAGLTSRPLADAPYAWSNVVIGGGGFVTGLVFHPLERGLRYARTDVGGAYRWDERAQRWTPLTDFIGMEDVNLTGIESLAIDPRDPQRLYLAAGTYTAPHISDGAIFASADRGATFHRCNLPFKMGANEAGRGNGERLAVDPNDGSRLLFGSRAAGLWRSRDHGRSWQQVPGFPSSASSDESRDESRWRQPLGIVFVLFAPASGRAGEATPVVYAGVSSKRTWLYRSDDGGDSWAPVPGQPLGLRPTRPALASDGTLYFSMADQPGPNTMSDGAVWKLEPATGAWTDISPLRPSTENPSWGYGAVCVDPSDPSRLLVSTFCRYAPNQDLILRSTDAGRTWKNLFENARFEHPENPWAAHHKPHWIADLRIDPFEPGHALFVTGYGLYGTRGLLAFDAAPSAPLVWTFDNRGLEETVPLGLISPPEGAHLLSGLGDIDGFRHDDLDRPGQTFAPTPALTNTESIAYAGLAPLHVVRAGVVRHHKGEVRAALSRDGGRTWQALASEPPQSAAAGHITLSSDGRVLVWTTRRAPPAGATGPELWRPYPNEPYRSTDEGLSWTACRGLAAGLRVVADRVNPDLFYAFDPATGTVFSSRDGARSFTQAATGLPATQPTPGGFGGGDKQGGRLHAVPGLEGVLWLETRTEGLHHSADAGRTWSRLQAPEQAYSLGFGRAAEGADHPALYLAGQLKGQKGLFRSLDRGANWQRIDDERHRFGWINHVTGDPRLFGRVYFATGGRGIIYGDPAR